MTSSERTLHRAFRYRLYPTPEQEAALRQISGVCRLVYNLAYEQRRDFWRQYQRTHGRRISFESQSADLKHLRAEYDWIAAVPYAAMSYALRDVDRAFGNFFAGRSHFPTPRRSRDGHGFRVPGLFTKVQTLSARWGSIKIPKLDAIRFRMTRGIPGAVRSVSINCTAGQWHVCFGVDWQEATPPARAGSVGIDLGVDRTVCLSTGDYFSGPTPDATTLRRTQRAVSRKKRGSARYAAQKVRLARLQARLARRRKDFAHKVSTDIARRFGVAVAEDLNVKKLTASATGTIDQPGKNVSQKRGLNRAILEQGWGILTTQLAYKIEERGGRLVFVDPKFTSQTCAACGVVDRESRKSQARFSCVHCGHQDNADVNAAKEILRRGTSELDAEAGVARPEKRQPEGAQHV